MAIAIDRAVLPDNGLRNYLRRVPNDCVLYYPGLDYGNWHTTTIKDYSGEVNDGTLTAVTTTKLPSGVHALTLNGSTSKIAVADSPVFDVGGYLTILFWFRSDSSTLSYAGLVLHDFSAMKYGVLWNTAGATSYFRFYVQTASGQVWDNDTNVYHDNQWRFAAAVYDKSLATGRVSHYINAVQAGATNGFAEDITAGDEGLTIGLEGANYYAGDLTLIRILNYALTADQILGIYQKEHRFFR